MAIQTATIEFQSGALNGVSAQIPAYLAQPVAAGSYPAVVVIQEIFGVNAHIREVANRIAQEGYIAIAPHIYHRQVPNFEVGYSDEEMALGRQYKAGTTAEELLSDIQGAIAYLRQGILSLDGKVGCIGFCFGGHVAYLAATLPEIHATASFYGAGIAQFTPGGGAPTLSHTAEITGTLYGFFGTEDALIPLAEVDAIEAALKVNQVPHQIIRYPGARHGFFCDHRASYDPAAATDAWAKVSALFAKELRISG
ncbi:dienelactone hydrolase family protein [Leptolyngbya sp. PCC 6406]|uniref:dienelactone hydrolase family protein n=1 Tax=Leptolyngbya sp. PCC 6406 TaxID=1173264 RepID=UPI0002ABF8A1|nr:dienelactone hydrolase family protein [Leptolyngbya sp. PCC 6406]